MKKLTYEEVKSYIESFNYKLLSKEYSGAQSKLNLRCPENHNFIIRWSDFKSGSRCQYCAKIKRGQNQRLTKEKISNAVYKRGDKLIDIIYKPKRTKLLLECKKEHHQYEIK